MYDQQNDAMVAVTNYSQLTYFPKHHSTLICFQNTGIDGISVSRESRENGGPIESLTCREGFTVFHFELSKMASSNTKTGLDKSDFREHMACM